MTLQGTYSDTTHTAHRASYDNAGGSIFTGQDIAGAVLIVIMIWGPLAAGAFLAP
jgi:hypothetical protein